MRHWLAAAYRLRVRDVRPQSSSVVRSTVLATAATFVGYGSTLVQQLVYARVIGVGASADALAAALAWSVVTTGLLGTTMVSVVVPPYIQLRVADPERAAALYRAASGLALATAGLASVGSFVLAGPLAVLLLPGADPGARQELAHLVRLTAPLHLIWVAVISATALANARGRYFVAGAASVVPSIVIVGALVIVGSPNGTAVGYVVGMIGQLVVLALVGRRWIADAIPSIRLGNLSDLLPRIVPVAAAFALMNATGIVVRALASLGGAGDVAALDYATRLSTAMEGVLLSGGLAVVLTIWAEDQVNDRPRLAIGRTLAAATVIACLAATGLVLLAPAVIMVLFEGGRFSADDVPRVAAALAAIAPGMAARMVLMVALRALLARQATWSLAIVGAIALAGVTMLSALGWNAAGLVGLGIGYSIGWILAAAATSVVALNGPRHERLRRPLAT